MEGVYGKRQKLDGTDCQTNDATSLINDENGAEEIIGKSSYVPHENSDSENVLNNVGSFSDFKKRYPSQKSKLIPMRELHNESRISNLAVNSKSKIRVPTSLKINENKKLNRKVTFDKRREILFDGVKKLKNSYRSYAHILENIDANTGAANVIIPQNREEKSTSKNFLFSPPMSISENSFDGESCQSSSKVMSNFQDEHIDTVNIHSRDSEDNITSTFSWVDDHIPKEAERQSDNLVQITADAPNSISRNNIIETDEIPMASMSESNIRNFNDNRKGENAVGDPFTKCWIDDMTQIPPSLSITGKDPTVAAEDRSQVGEVVEASEESSRRNITDDKFMDKRIGRIQLIYTLC